MAIFTTYFSLSNIGQKIDILPKGLDNGFGPQWPFLKLFLGNICYENVFYGIIQQKQNFLFDKNKELKKSKNWPFCKGVSPWFWSKMAIFPTYFFVGNTT